MTLVLGVQIANRPHDTRHGLRMQNRTASNGGSCSIPCPFFIHVLQGNVFDPQSWRNQNGGVCMIPMGPDIGDSPPNSRGHATKRGLRVPNPNSRGHATKRGLQVPNPNLRGHVTKRGFRDCPGFLNSTGRLGPKRGRKCYVTPAFSGVPNKGTKSEVKAYTRGHNDAPSISKYGSPVQPNA